MTSKESFANVESWLQEVEKHSGDDVNIMVLANKSDLDEEIVVTEAEIAQFEKEKNIPVIRTSAKTGEGVDDCFLEMTKKLIVKKSQSASSGSTDEKKRQMGLSF